MPNSAEETIQKYCPRPWERGGRNVQSDDAWRSVEGEPRCGKPVGDDPVHAARHLRRHVVEPRIHDAAARRSAILEASQALEAAELDDAEDDAGVLLRPREGLPDEPRQLPELAGRVAQQLLVAQEEHGGVTAARAPVAEDVFPEGPVPAVAVADGVQGGRKVTSAHSFRT